MPGIVHWGHPAFLGYFGSTTNGPALVGEMIAAALNVSAMTWQTVSRRDGARDRRARLDPPHDRPAGYFTGVVYDTASIAVLHALAAARERCGVDVRARGTRRPHRRARHRVYASDQAHSSIEKAMIVLGLGEANVVRIPSDEAFRLDVAALRTAIQDDRRAGFRPMAVVATVGTTSTASVDPVRDIAAVCREHGIWLHVDAAYGGAMAILPEGRGRWRASELADSVVVNPHKWMFVPLDFSVLFVRRPELLRAVFALTPDICAGMPGPARSTTWTTGSSSAAVFGRSRRGWSFAHSDGTASPRGSASTAGSRSSGRDGWRPTPVSCSLRPCPWGWCASVSLPPGSSERACDRLNARSSNRSTPRATRT